MKPYTIIKSNRTGQRSLVEFDFEHGNINKIPEALAQVDEIGASVFQHEDIEEVKLPKNVIEINNCAFKNSNLRKINLENVKRIGRDAFARGWLEQVNFASDVEIFDNAFLSNGIKYLNIGKDVKLLGSYIFANNEELSTVIIEEGHKRIPSGTFRNCVSLTNLTLPKSIIVIGGNAFRNTGLREITIPEQVEVIEPDTFAECEHLVSVKFPNHKMVIKQGAFRDCPKLKCVVVPQGSRIEEGAFDKGVDIRYATCGFEQRFIQNMINKNHEIVQDDIYKIREIGNNGAMASLKEMAESATTRLNNYAENVFDDYYKK